MSSCHRYGILVRVGSSPHPEEVEAAGSEPAQSHLLHVEQAQDRLDQAEEEDIDVGLNIDIDFDLNIDIDTYLYIDIAMSNQHLDQAEDKEGGAKPELCRHRVELRLRGQHYEAEEQRDQVGRESRPGGEVHEAMR